MHCARGARLGCPNTRCRRRSSGACSETGRDGSVLLFEDQDVVIAQAPLEPQHELAADRLRSVEAMNLGAEWGTIRPDLHCSIRMAHAHSPSLRLSSQISVSYTRRIV